MRRPLLPRPGSHPGRLPTRLAPPALLLILALLPACAMAWTPGGSLLSDATSWMLPPTYSGDGHGGAAAFWCSGSHGLSGSRLDAEGNALGPWLPAGLGFLTTVPSVTAVVSAPDGTGGHYVAGYEALSGPTGPRPFLLTRVQSDGALAPGWSPGGRVLADSAHAKVLPRLFPDGTGGVYLVWLDALSWGLRFEFGVQYIGVHEVRAIRLTGDGQAAPGWPADGVQVTVAPEGAAATAMLALQAAADGSGGVFIAWTDSLDGVGDVWMQHLAPDGTPASGWSTGGRPMASPAAYRELTALIPDGTGGVLISWGEYRDLHYQAFVQRFDAIGAIAAGWTAGGISLCHTCTWPSPGPLASDAAGGALVGIQDWRDGYQADVFALRVRGDGTFDPAWQADGEPLSSSTQHDVFQGAVPDGLGGATFLWANQSTSGPPQDQLMATHLTVSGAVADGWPAGGLTVSSRSGYLMQAAALAPDGYGGAVAMWTLRETPSYAANTFAARLPRGGLTGVEPPVAAVAPALSLAIAPNPFAGAARVTLALPRAARIAVEVFDMGGRRVRAIADGTLSAGTHALAWDGRDGSGAPAPAGIYLVRAHGDDLDVTRRVVRLE